MNHHHHIAASELILNQDGSIYHLGLLPEQIAPLIITVGDPDRVSKVSSYFDAIEHRVQRREFVTHTGRIGARRVSVVSTGIGTDNIDIVLNELDALFNIDFGLRQVKANLTSVDIIRLGTTGGLQAAVPVGSLVASVGAFGMEGLINFYQSPTTADQPILTALKKHAEPDWDFPIAPYFATVDPHLLDQFQGDFLKGYTATMSGFYGPQGRSLRLPLRSDSYIQALQTFEYQNNKVLNLEMETAGIYGLAGLLGHRALSLSVILANRANGTFSNNPEKAVQGLIEKALSRLF